MNTSRRHAIRLGLCATASLVAVPGLSEATPQASQKQQLVSVDDGAFLRRDLFESQYGQSFIVRTEKTAVALRLLRVDDQPGARRSGSEGNENNFVVVFRGPRAPKLAQGTYQVDSRSLGTFELFLVPEKATTPGTIYTATFNRLA
jgi:hypothetical protein